MRRIFFVVMLCFVTSVAMVCFAQGGKTPFQQAKELYNNGQCQQAIPLFKKVAKENPKKADEAYYFIGMCQSKAQNYAQAVDSFSEALKLRSDYAQALRA